MSDDQTTSTTEYEVNPTLLTFMTADTARSESTQWSLIDEEIQSIQNEITSAITSNKFSVTITDTTMTSTTTSTGLPYFRVHHGLDVGLDTSYDQMDIHTQISTVKNTFTDLGYVFQIVDNPTYTNTLMWLINW